MDTAEILLDVCSLGIFCWKAMLSALHKTLDGMQESALERLVEALQEQQSAEVALEAAQQVGMFAITRAMMP